MRRTTGIYSSRRTHPVPEPVSLSSSHLEGILNQVKGFLEPYFPLFHRTDMALTAWLYLQGLLSTLPRKSAEPIAELHDIDRKVLQRFVGVSPWSDRRIRDRMLEDVSQTIGDPCGVLCVDPSAFPKKGKKSVGVKRQWCGRTGKKDNCQIGVFASYASPKGRCLLDTKLALPKEWIDDKQRRIECHIPEDQTYLKHWELADEVLKDVANVPHACILGDSEMGRCGEFRDRLAQRGEHYILDIPVSLKIRVVRKGRPTSKPIQAGKWMAHLPNRAWTRVKTREGSQGERIIEIYREEVLTERKDGTFRKETFLALRPAETPHDVRFTLANMPKNTSLEEMAQYGTRRWTIEDCLERAKSECGMGQYEVRSWVGWHHHMTMAMLAVWLLEKLRLSKQGESFPPSNVPVVRVDPCGDHFKSSSGSRKACQKNFATFQPKSYGNLLSQTQEETLLSCSRDG